MELTWSEKEVAVLKKPKILFWYLLDHIKYKTIIEEGLWSIYKLLYLNNNNIQILNYKHLNFSCCELFSQSIGYKRFTTFLLSITIIKFICIWNFLNSKHESYWNSHFQEWTQYFYRKKCAVSKQIKCIFCISLQVILFSTQESEHV